LIRWSTSAEPGEVAALAPMVLEVAAKNDAVASTIVESAAEELASLVKAVLEKFPGKAGVPVALAGGNLQPDRALRPLLLARLGKVGRAAPVQAPLDPTLGALSLARRLSP